VWPWDVAWTAALYGAEGFYRRPEGPAGHFRTATHAAAPVLAGALATLADRHGCSAIVDVGAGRGELLLALAEVAPHLRLHGVDVVERPPALTDRFEQVGWSAGLHRLPDGALAGALIVAWELLDVVPCPVVEVDGAGYLRTVLVDDGGRERLGEPLPAEQRAWCERWWPLTEPGARAEVGLPRDKLWSALVARAAAAGGTAGTTLLAVDYGHDRVGRPPGGTLVGYRQGRLVPAVPDGSCDVTAHVALDAVTDAGERAGARTLERTDQRAALRALGLTGRWHAGEVPSAASLRRISAEAELLDPTGLGSFGWLLQGVR
jgi:SAM-dependent MidA family methyltransferase